MSKFWITDYLLIQKGYSKSDIEKMETEEYDFLIPMIVGLKNKGKDHPFGGI